MKLHTAVIAILQTVSSAQETIADRFEGDVAHAQLRVELEAVWQILKLLASAIDEEGATSAEPLDLPTKAEIEAIVQASADRAALESSRSRRR